MDGLMDGFYSHLDFLGAGVCFGLGLCFDFGLVVLMEWDFLVLVLGLVSWFLWSGMGWDRVVLLSYFDGDGDDSVTA